MTDTDLTERLRGFTRWAELTVMGVAVTACAGVFVGYIALSYKVRTGAISEDDELVQDPLGILASELTALATEPLVWLFTAWVVIPVTPLALGGYLAWRYRLKDKLETDGPGGEP